VQLIGVDDAEDRFAGLAVSDSPSGNDVRRRIWLGRDDDGDASLALLDGEGRKRIVMKVAEDGECRISVLDAEAETVRALLQRSAGPACRPGTGSARRPPCPAWRAGLAGGGCRPCCGAGARGPGDGQRRSRNDSGSGGSCGPPMAASASSGVRWTWVSLESPFRL